MSRSLPWELPEPRSDAEGQNWGAGGVEGGIKLYACVSARFLTKPSDQETCVYVCISGHTVPHSRGRQRADTWRPMAVRVHIVCFNTDGDPLRGDLCTGNPSPALEHIPNPMASSRHPHTCDLRPRVFPEGTCVHLGVRTRARHPEINARP
uniref:Uncharacterized protein n=1 Tax=Myotis myotis TaxID=51298 RepID=A0A7J7SCB9_MYOMY|nr:hypothetical protein mMyoMyo1_009549 [Myotis myotis]